MRVLVTGAAGFLGRRVARLALERGLEVRTTSRGEREPWSSDHVRTDLLEAGALRELCRGVHVVIHCAGVAHRPHEGDAAVFWRGNVQATKVLCDAAATEGVARFILVGSVAVYGAASGEMRDESTPCRPETEYARSKLEAERCVLAHALEMSVVVLRMGTLVGENDPGNVLRLIRAIDRPVFPFVGDGANRKTLLYVEDAADACLLAASATDVRGVVNVVGHAQPVRLVVKQIAEALGRRSQPIRLPAGLAKGLARLGDVILGRTHRGGLGAVVDRWLSDEVFSAERAREALAFTPKTAIEEALRREVRWYRETYT